MKRPLLIGAAVVLATAAVAGFLVMRSLDDQTAATSDDVMAEFRKEAGPAKTGDLAGVAPQGVYSYRVKGHEKIVRALTIERDLPTEATMMVFHRDGGFDTRTIFSREHVEDAHYAVAPDGAYLTKAVTTISAGPIRTVRERDWNPRLLRFPAKSHAPWGGAYQAGDIAMTVKAREEAPEEVDVAGTAVKARVFSFHQIASGEYSGTRDETFWVDGETGILLRYRIVSSLTGPTNLDFTADQTLTSMTPRT